MSENVCAGSASEAVSAAHEATCRRCGCCCAVKYIVDGVIFNTTRFCEHLEPRTHFCRVYPRRRQINSHCLDVAAGVKLGVFPADCPYVEGVKRYTPPYPIPLDDETERAVLSGAAGTAVAIIRLLQETKVHA